MSASSGNGLPNLVTIPKGYAALNTYGMQLANLAAWHLQRIGNTGLLAAAPAPGTTQAIGTLPNPAATQGWVWKDEPPGSVPFDEQGTQALPAPTFGVDIPVVTMLVPQGYDGVIKWISNNLVSANPPVLSGQLIWKILINGRPARNFGNITQEKGTIYQGREISPIRIFSGDTVTYTAQQATGSDVAGETVCSLTGYYYPSRGVS